jgi:dihydropteroate synthase
LKRGEQVNAVNDAATNVSTPWKKVFHTVENRAAPILMGILNLTPDSFSDGGRFLDPAAAAEQALKLEADGAHILDIGAESTRPGHVLVSEEEELRRLLPVLDRLTRQLKIPVSIDTSKAGVARVAFDHGAAMLNDVAALTRPGMAEFARAGDFPVILMHGVAHALPEDYATPSATIAAWLAARIAELGIAKERIIVDPGIGFGTTRPQDAAILENLAPLVALGYPVLIGLSRKRIVRHLHPDADRDLASAQMALEAWRQGAVILRQHQIRPFRQLFGS